MSRFRRRRNAWLRWYYASVEAGRCLTTRAAIEATLARLAKKREERVLPNEPATGAHKQDRWDSVAGGGDFPWLLLRGPQHDTEGRGADPCSATAEGAGAGVAASFEDASERIEVRVAHRGSLARVVVEVKP